MAQYARHGVAARERLILTGLAAASCLCVFIFPFFSFLAFGLRLYSQGAAQYAINVQPVFFAPLALAVLMLVASLSDSATFRVGAAGAYILSLLVCGIALRSLVFGGDVQWLLRQATSLMEQVGAGEATRGVVEGALGMFLRLDYGYYLSLILAAGFVAASLLLPGAGHAPAARPAARGASAPGARPWDRPKGGQR